MHWAHGIEDTDAHDVVGSSYLFNSLDVGDSVKSKRILEACL